jgi:hypothetical protein
MPARQAAMTSSGPETRNMGAQTTGKRNVARRSANRLRDSAVVMGRFVLWLADGNFHY